MLYEEAIKHYIAKTYSYDIDDIDSVAVHLEEGTHSTCSYGTCDFGEPANITLTVKLKNPKHGTAYKYHYIGEWSLVEFLQELLNVANEG